MSLKPKSYEEILEERVNSLYRTFIMTSAAISPTPSGLPASFHPAYYPGAIPPPPPIAVPTYTYPDGITSTRKPVDGEKCTHTYGSILGNYTYGHVDEYIYDGMHDKWYLTSTNRYAIPALVDPFSPPPESEFSLENAVCECGKDIHGFASHSTWCKKFKPNT